MKIFKVGKGTMALMYIREKKGKKRLIQLTAERVHSGCGYFGTWQAIQAESNLVEAN